MWFWLIIWVLLSCFLLGVFGWSMAILYQQKKAWAAFGKKHGMEYQAGKMTGPPQLTGKLGNYKVSLFTDAQRTNDVRGQRLVTVMEIEMGAGMPTAGAVATKEYAAFISTLDLDETWSPDDKEWGASYVIKTRSAERLATYLTPERLKVLKVLFAKKNSISLLFFDENQSVLRVETSDPLRNPEHMEKITSQMMGLADKLRPSALAKKNQSPEDVEEKENP